MKFKVHIVVNIRHGKLIRLACRTVRHMYTRVRRRLRNSLFIAVRNCVHEGNRACLGITRDGSYPALDWRCDRFHSDKTHIFPSQFQFQFIAGPLTVRGLCVHITDLEAAVDRPPTWGDVIRSHPNGLHYGPLYHMRMSFIHAIGIVSHIRSSHSIWWRALIRLGR